MSGHSAWPVVPMAVAMWLALVGCGGGAGAPCEFDSDCDAVNLCVDEVCTPTCETDGDCPASYDRCESTVRPGQSEPVRVCVEEGGGQADAGCTADAGCCDSDDECRQRLDAPTAVCSDDRRCIVPLERHGVRIRDLTDVAGQTPTDGSPGADIAAVYLREATTEQPVGWARTLLYDPAAGTEGTPTRLDGTPIALTTDGQCVLAGFNETIVALGGQPASLVVAFYDDAGQRLQLSQDQEVVVVEWGTNCGADDADRYAVDRCATTAGTIDPAAGDCDTALTVDPRSGLAVVPAAR